MPKRVLLSLRLLAVALPSLTKSSLGNSGAGWKRAVSSGCFDRAESYSWFTYPAVPP